MIEAFRRRHSKHRADFSGAAGLPKDRHVIWIAAEVADILFDPLERQYRILHTGIAAVRIFFAEFAKIKVAEDIQAMVYSNDNDIVFLREIMSIIERERG